MIKEKECLAILLNPAVRIGEKASVFAEYIAHWSLVGRRVGLGIRGGRTFGYEQLLGALPEKDRETKQQLEGVINAILEYRKQEERKHDDENKATVQLLHSLKKGTCLIIHNQNREDLVRLVEVKRTRFVCEYPDGRLYDMPVGSFVRVEATRTFEPLCEETRQLRDLVRNLAGARHKQTRTTLVGRGVSIIESLLDELAAALNRIENAPRGISGGLLGAALGPVKKVNPRDEALVKRIPEVIGEIARKTGAQKVQRQIKSYPNATVRRHCEGVLDRLNP